MDLTKCEICPHKCGVNRTKGEIGRCKSTDKIKIGLYSIHHFEEPCISGKHGSGTVFFSNCNLNCVYCQNYEISQQGKGKEISIEELANIFIEQQNRQAENINLVTPTSYALQIVEAIKIAKKNGLPEPRILQIKFSEVQGALATNNVDFIVPTGKLQENVTQGVKVILGTPFVTGVNEEKAEQAVLEALKA